jgi:putative transposase
MNVKHGRTSVYAIEYHIVFVTKYRRKVIEDDIKDDLYKALENVCKKNKTYQIQVINGKADHVYLLVTTNPQQSIPVMIKQLKGSSAKTILATHPELKEKLWGGHFWSPTYFIATVSENTESQIEEYIESQDDR